MLDAPRPSSRSGLDENERPFGVERAGDKLQMAVVARQAEIADPGHPYQFFRVALMPAISASET